MSPKYVLDENLLSCYGSKDESLYINSDRIAKAGTSDDILLQKATNMNLLIITHDIRFVLKTLIQNQNIIYETIEGERYFLSGKDSKLMDYNEARSKIKWRTKRVKRMLEFSNRMPFCLPLNGFYLVCSL